MQSIMRSHSHNHPSSLNHNTMPYCIHTRGNNSSIPGTVRRSDSLNGL